MTAFVHNGPDIPEQLLHDHQEGRVVFFCGAGISYPAGLPGFEGLVKKIIKELSVSLEKTEENALKKKAYDTVLSLLEKRLVNGRLEVRKAVANILKPDLSKRESVETHRSLLKLAKDSQDRIRLITTNFDRIFCHVIQEEKLTIPSFSAPLLPIPKKCKWDGIVYLHGILPEVEDEVALNKLVVSSGDFGLAYLIERWAARFMSELLRNFIVVFVGYSINDPVLRYMVDALAADELLGESWNQAYAFASFDRKNQGTVLDDWKAKNVQPILYKTTPRKKNKHSLLINTLKIWSEVYTAGGQGKKWIISQYASNPPASASITDLAVGNVLWALTDRAAASHFANTLSPFPPFEWIKPLSFEQYEEKDLYKFGVVEKNVDHQNKQKFSFINHPASHLKTPKMCLVHTATQNCHLDNVMVFIARWLTRHMGNPKLIAWIAKQGGVLHDQFARFVENQLKEYDKGNETVIKELHSEDHTGHVWNLIRPIWRIILEGRLLSTSNPFFVTEWLKMIKLEGVSSVTCKQLINTLTPFVSLREHIPSEYDRFLNYKGPVRLSDLIEWEISIYDNDPETTLRCVRKDPFWPEIAKTILPELVLLLKDALELMKTMGGADEFNDLTYFHYPSIADHPQNKGFHKWTYLIEWVRESWLVIKESDLAKARRIAEDWWDTPFPLFKRMVFFAGTFPEVISKEHSFQWLLSDQSRWLWSIDTRREIMRLLVHLAPLLDRQEQEALEKSILDGPSEEYLSLKKRTKKERKYIDHLIWHRLAKIKSAGLVLSITADKKLKALEKKYPGELEPEERDEFLFWMDERVGYQHDVPLPEDIDELIEWLKTHIKLEFEEKDAWRKLCREKWDRAFYALSKLAMSGVFIPDHWKPALNAWSDNDLPSNDWLSVAKVLNKAPDSFFKECAHAISWWLRSISQYISNSESIFLEITRRIIHLEYQVDGYAPSIIGQAINHPVGMVTDAIIRHWFTRKPKEGAGIDGDIKHLLNTFFDGEEKTNLFALCELSIHITSFYRVDPEWTCQKMIPLFDWSHPNDTAKYIWQGFLRSPKIYNPLLFELKKPILETVRHLQDLHDLEEQYVDFITIIALSPNDVFKDNELRTVFNALNTEQLKKVAHTLVRSFEGVDDKKRDFWEKQLQPFLKNFWPKSRNLVTPVITHHLAHLCVDAGDLFPEVYEMIKNYMVPMGQTYLSSNLTERSVCEKFPAEALAFLGRIVSVDCGWNVNNVRECLAIIGSQKHELITDRSYRKLDDYVKRFS